MTPEDFNKWLEEMKSSGLARFDADCARLLGYRQITEQKKRGGDHRLALACQALLHKLTPYGGT